MVLPISVPLALRLQSMTKHSLFNMGADASKSGPCAYVTAIAPTEPSPQTLFLFLKHNFAGYKILGE